MRNYHVGVSFFSFIVFIAVIAILIFNPVVIVGSGKRGVTTTWGSVSDNVRGEGLGFKTPIAQGVIKFDVQTQKLETNTLAYSKDLQTVDSKLALNYHIKPEVVNKLYQEVGRDYASRIIDPSIQESVKASTAKFTAQELIDQRPKVKDEIKVELNNRLNRYFVVDEFSIIDFSFSDEYEKAIEAKQVAQQNALKAENDLTRIKVEAEQRVAQARAEAEAIKIQTEALSKNSNLISLEWVKRWNGVLPSYVLGTDVNALLNLPTK